ncbi:MAG: PLDc N-terminal domain-containing protein [Caldilineaceae bacterium]|nr:PLDc N-terminal domain-containing protein [Caldilineaceae bacterium]
MLLPELRQWLVLIGALVLLVVLAVMALASKEARGGSKLVWVLLSVLFSFVGYFAYYFVAVRGKR